MAHTSGKKKYPATPGHPSSREMGKMMRSQGMGKPMMPGKEMGMAMKGTGRQGMGKGAVKRKR